MEKKYRALRIVSSIYKILAVLGFIFTVIGAVFLFAQTYQMYSREPSLATTGLINAALLGGGSLLSGFIVSLSLYAFANLVDLLVATEENTRATALLLQRLIKDRAL